MPTRTSLSNKVIWIGLTLAVMGSAGCSTKVGPNDPDGRRCFPAVLDTETAMLLRASRNWDVKAGDLIQTKACALQDSRDRLNALYEITR